MGAKLAECALIREASNEKPMAPSPVKDPETPEKTVRNNVIDSSVNAAQLPVKNTFIHVAGLDLPDHAEQRVSTAAGRLQTTGGSTDSVLLSPSTSPTLPAELTTA